MGNLEAKRAAKTSQQGAEFLERVVDMLGKAPDIKSIKKIFFKKRKCLLIGRQVGHKEPADSMQYSIFEIVETVTTPMRHSLFRGGNRNKHLCRYGFSIPSCCVTKVI